MQTDYRKELAALGWVFDEEGVMLLMALQTSINCAGYTPAQSLMIEWFHLLNKAG